MALKVNGYYYHKAYATADNGEGFSLSIFDDAVFVGSYADKTESDSLDPGRYTWELIDDFATDDEDDEPESDIEERLSNLEDAAAETMEAVEGLKEIADTTVTNDNLLTGTNNGISGWAVTGGSIEAISDTVYDDTPVSMVRATGGSISFANGLELDGENSYTLSFDIRSDSAFSGSVSMGGVEFDPIELDEKAIDTFTSYQSTAEPLTGDIVITGNGQFDIANLKLEAGADATPWKRTIGEVATESTAASRAAAEAKAAAEATGQRFWSDDSGAHVTEIEKDEFLKSPSGNNILINALGVLIRSGLVASASFTKSGIAFYGSDGETPIATFGLDDAGKASAVIGSSSESRIELDYRSMTLFSYDGWEKFKVEDLRDDSGVVTVTDSCEIEGGGGTYFVTVKNLIEGDSAKIATNTGEFAGTKTNYYTFTFDATEEDVSKGVASVTYQTKTPYAVALTFGDRVGDTGSGSIALGHSNVASGGNSVSIGGANVASGMEAVAIGDGNLSSSEWSYTFGSRCNASEDNSVAIGYSAHAAQGRSISIGHGTKSTWYDQIAIGAYNEGDTGNLLELGNGKSDDYRSNALAVDFKGNVTAAGRYNIYPSLKTLKKTGTISSIAANGYASVSINADTEYVNLLKPIAICGYDISGAGTASAQMIKYYLTDDNKAFFGVKNDASTARTNWTVTAYVLYATIADD